MADLPTLTYVLLIPLGLLISTYGTLIGAGSGFVIVRTLLLLYPTRIGQCRREHLVGGFGAGFQFAGIAALCLRGPLRHT